MVSVQRRHSWKCMRFCKYKDARKLNVGVLCSSLFCYTLLCVHSSFAIILKWKRCKKCGKYQELIQSSTTPDPGYHIEIGQKHN